MGSVLITCTFPRAQDYVSDLHAKNIPASPIPALDVSALKTPLPKDDFEAMVVTSTHAFIADLLHLPIIAVGDETAKIARKNGFDVIHVGDGGVNDLDVSPYKKLLYPCAAEPSDSPNNCTPWPVYQTQINPNFKITDDHDVICVFSVKAAKIIQKYPLRGKTILCLSAAIADVFAQTRHVKLAVARTPRYDAMIDLIQTIRRDTYMTHTDGFKDVDTLINRFGGMRPMARKLDVAVSTIQGWKKRDHIPSDRVAEVIAAARNNNVSLDGFDVSNENMKPDTNDVKESPETIPSSSQSSAVAPKAMRQSNEKPQAYSMDTRQIKRDMVKRSAITTVSIIAILGGLGYFLFGNEAKQVATIAQEQQQIERQVTSLSDQFQSFEATVTDGLNSLSDQVTSLTDQTTPLSQRMATLENRLRSTTGQQIDLSQLVSRFENLTQAVDGQGDTAQAFTDLQSIVDSLQARVATLDASLEQAKTDNAEIAQSMQGVTGRDLTAAAMLLAMTQMRDSMNRAEPFEQDLAILQELVGTDDPELTSAIARLSPYAESGILTPAGISSELRGVSGDIIAAALRGENVSVQEKIMARIGQILSVERNGEPLMGIEEQAIIARAQNALDNGDVQTALNELNKLEGEAATVANPITDKLSGAVNADQTISMMMETLLKKLQNPQSIEGFIRNIPQEINRQMQGTLTQDDASGIIILE